MKLSSVDLEQMLESRVIRADTQSELISEHGLPLVCLTLNIAGDVKRTPLGKLLFQRGVELARSFGVPVCERLYDKPTGFEGFFVFDIPAEQLKSLCLKAESSFPAARLFDFDVLDTDGEKLSRDVPRGCLICDEPAAACARSRAHGLDAVKQATQNLLVDFAASRVDSLACGALYDELYATPKPGLVDRDNNGAHSDMTVETFERSIRSLSGYFACAFKCGYSGDAHGLLAAGQKAEREMLKATENVNTHKGAVYTLGLLSAGFGRAINDGDIVSNSGMYAAVIRHITCGIEGLANNKLYGARLQAREGFSDVCSAAEYITEYTERDDREVLTLCRLMETVADTNVLRRGGDEGLRFMHAAAAEINAAPIDERVEKLREMDREMIERNLSPGGCADILAAGVFLNAITKMYDEMMSEGF